MKKLLLTVGPTATITLRNAAGKALRGLTAGNYTVIVRDRSKLHNAHLVGKGVNRKSGLAATGTFTWKVKLAAGPLRFFSDRSPTKVKGSIKVSRGLAKSRAGHRSRPPADLTQSRHLGLTSPAFSPPAARISACLSSSELSSAPKSSANAE